MLLGAGKKRRQEGTDDIVEDQELESATVSLRSHLPEIHDSGIVMHWRFVCYAMRFVLRGNRSQDDSSLDCDGGIDSVGTVSPLFEFQKAERAAQRVPLAHFSKPAPSKWDDAQKWIASPTSNRPKTGQSSQEPVDTKQIDSGQPKDSGVQKFVSWEAEPHPIAESYVKPMLMTETSIGQSANFCLFLI
ncbi:hypothetical protein KY285_000257 [Solanum tuberosum]|nr:hypothetical protein KY284_000294 [Solanum tuberosum]KAH0764386.1 hypothetical protein KY285_000257 [Solanum tuberosum]